MTTMPHRGPVLRIALGMVLASSVMAGCGTQAQSATVRPSEASSSTGSPARSSASVADYRTGPLIPLAKADRWRPALEQELGRSDPWPYAVLEIAYSAHAARLAWQQNLPPGQTRRTGLPSLPGMYGSLDDVDMTTQAVVVFSSGQSGSCPDWLADVQVQSSGSVKLTTDAGTHKQPCRMDYREYRLVLAVDRAKLPQETQLPIRSAILNGSVPGNGVLIRTYPAI